MHHHRIGTALASAATAAVLAPLLVGGCGKGLPPAGFPAAGAAADPPASPGPDADRPLVTPSALVLEGGAHACIRLRCGRFLCPPGLSLPDPPPPPPPIPHGERCPAADTGPPSSGPADPAAIGRT
jgi:hypothetical protein